MPKPIFSGDPNSDGSILTADVMNALVHVCEFDGLDEVGHHPPLTDDQFSNATGQLKDRLGKLVDQLKVEHTNGLGIQWKPGAIRLVDGSTIAIPAGVATLPNNATSFVYIKNGGMTIEIGASLPPSALRIARLTTANGVITENADLRVWLSVPFDTIHGALSEQTQALREQVDELEEAITAGLSSIDDSISAALDFAGNAGDVLLLGTDGRISPTPARQVQNLNADSLDGVSANLTNPIPGQVITIGEDGKISNQDLDFDLSYIDLGQVPATGQVSVEVNQAYLFESLAATARVIIPRPTKAGDTLVLANRGSSAVTLDFSLNASDETTGDASLAAMSTIEMVSTGTTTGTWIHIPRVTTPQGRVASTSSSGGGGGGSSGGGTIPAEPTTRVGAMVEAAAWAPVGVSTQTILSATDATASYTFETQEFVGNQNWSAGASLGTTTADNRFTLARVIGNLTIGPGSTVSATARKLGLILFVTGDLILDGMIDMTARGANHAGIPSVGLRLTKLDYMSAVGGAGGSCISRDGGPTTGPVRTGGYAASTGGGGGGGGGAQAGALSPSGNYAVAASSGGSSGSCFSGGSGGGGAYATTSSAGQYSSASSSGAGSGGAGGAGVFNNGPNPGTIPALGGGAGNPGGGGAYGGSSGSSGTGGMIHVFCLGSILIGANGGIVSRGSSGGNGTLVGGGGSGGGGINLFFQGSIGNEGTLDTSGGAGGGGTPNYLGANATTGGAGGILTKKISSLLTFA